MPAATAGRMQALRSWYVLFFQEQDLERVWKDGAARVGIVCGGGWWRAEFCCDREEVVSLSVEGHGARAGFCLDVFCHRELLGGILFYDRQYAFSAGGEGQSGLIVIRCCIYTFPDCGGCEDFATIGIDYRHHFIIAAYEEAAMLPVQS